jgi:hypothetical protein
MYLFLLFGLPLGFFLLVLQAYPRSEYEATRRAFARGLVAFLPVWLIARILGALVPEMIGSLLYAFHEWADRILPYAALPGLAYLVFYAPHESLPAGAGPRRLSAFYAGSLCPVGLIETIRIWGNPEPYALFLLPMLLGAICLIMPKVVAHAYSAYGIALAATIVAFAAVCFAASLCPFLILARLWPLALLIVGAAGAGAWYFAYPELLRRPAATVGE